MFGSDLDFFGVYALRKRMALDFDKRKKIADAQARLESLGKEFDVEKIFLGKDILFEKLVARRRLKHLVVADPLAMARGQRPQRTDPVVAAALHAIREDRLENLPSLLKTLNKSQRALIEQALVEHQNRLIRDAEVQEPETEEGETEYADEMLMGENLVAHE